MRKNTIAIIMLSLIMLSGISCQKDDPVSVSDNPFDLSSETENEVRNKIVVISDLHLGNDLSYSECVTHLPRLTEFLTEIRESKTVKELVIAGDMLDEWYVPSRTDTYGGKTQKEFIQKIATANKSVIDVLNGIIRDGNVKVTYTPGNHDLLVEKENVDAILPGINQARDAGKLGIGTYRPDGYPQIAIEHSNRYDFFCSPDPYSNQDIASGSILPPGYFFTRIAVNSITNPPTAVGDTTRVRTVTLNSTDATQINNYTYYKTWQYVLMSYIPVKDNFEDKIIVTNIGNYTGNFSVNDLVPYNKADGSINMTLFSGACNQETWERRLAYNNVPVMTSVKEAIPGSLSSSYIDALSNTQYFQNDTSKVRIVVFGHTHNPIIRSYANKKGECVYANSGTWIDKKIKNGETVDQDIQNMDFIVIMPLSTDSSMIKVERFKYKKGKHVSMESKSIQL